ncbi:spirocyclase AveC family protein [Actinomadura terrae]|uniref:spirocyclase AveC family protein n=1 Tax=Actinomadura terrae TaxID=604353 RepID=UPI001FA6F79E|nr:spirocyclase AveC family protein [Actinomadura terrae]
MKSELSGAVDETVRTRRLSTTPAFWCALVGVAALLVQAWVLVRWAAAGVRSPRYSGDSISSARTATIWTIQAGLVVIAIGTVVYLTRDCRRRRSLTLDAGLFLGLVLSSWQSPLFNYRETALVVNQHLVHVNSWGPYIPGWDPPHREFQIEAPIAVTWISFGLLILWVWLQAWMGNRIAARFPNLTWRRLVIAVFVAGLVTDFVIESAWLNTGVYSHAHAWRPVTLFAGHWYNVPLPAVFVASAFTTPFVLMRYLERTRGVTPWIYRGAELASSSRAGNLTRVLAAIGAANVAVFAYLLWFILWAGVGGPMPADTPSYMWPLNAR